MGVSVLVAVLVVYIGEYGTLNTVFVNVDALVEPCFLELEAVLSVFGNVYGLAFVLDFDVTYFDAIDRVAGILRIFGRFGLLVDFHFENASVEPRSAKVRDPVEVVSCDDREILPECVFGQLGSLDKRSKAVALSLVLFSDIFFPLVVEFLLIDAEDFLNGSVKCHAVVF